MSIISCTLSNLRTAVRPSSIKTLSRAGLHTFSRSITTSSSTHNHRIQSIFALQKNACFSTDASSSSPAHSSTSTSNTTPELRHQILQSALKHVRTLGWTNAAVLKAIDEIGLSKATIGLFPKGGAAELVEFFISSCNQQLPHALLNMQPSLSSMRMTQRIFVAVKTRLEMQAPYISTWPQAMAVGAQPSNLPTTLHNIALMVDDMWHAAGDRSTDMNWYSKRALLGSVYAATELFMLTDRSVNYADTWAFLQRRLEDVLALGKISNQILDTASLLTSVAVQGVSRAPQIVSTAFPLVSTVANTFFSALSSRVNSSSSSSYASAPTSSSLGSPTVSPIPLSPDSPYAASKSQ